MHSVTLLYLHAWYRCSVCAIYCTLCSLVHASEWSTKVYLWRPASEKHAHPHSTHPKEFYTCDLICKNCISEKLNRKKPVDLSWRDPNIKQPWNHYQDWLCYTMYAKPRSTWQSFQSSLENYCSWVRWPILRMPSCIIIPYVWIMVQIHQALQDNPQIPNSESSMRQWNAHRLNFIAEKEWWNLTEDIYKHGWRWTCRTEHPLLISIYNTSCDSVPVTSIWKSRTCKSTKDQSIYLLISEGNMLGQTHWI
jgi:hypothetical protein